MKKKKRTRIIRNVVIAAVILAVVCGFLFIRNAASRNASPMDADTRTNFSTTGTITASLSSSGTLSPKDTYSITSLVSGEVVASYFEEGDVVEKDDVLYEINSSSMESQVRSAENTLTRAEKTYNDAVDDYNEAVERYSGNVYRSTKSGYIKTLNVEEGDKITNNANIAAIYSDEVMKITVPFLTADADTIYVGETADVVLSDTDEELEGVVTHVGSLERTLSGGRLVRDVEVEVKNPGGLSTDMTAYVSVGTSVTYELQPVTITTQVTESSPAEPSWSSKNKSYSDEMGIGPGFADEESTVTKEETIYEEVPVIHSIVSVEEGTFEPVLDKSMQAELMGNGSIEIEKMLVHEGDYITVGTPLFTLNAEDVEDILESYKDAIDTAEERVESAQTNVDNIEDNYDNYTITAPISGTVITKNTKTGDNVNNGTSSVSTMAVIYDLSELTFEMSIDELDIQSVKVGQKVEVTADAIDGVVFEGEVTKVSLQSSYSNGVTNYPITVTLTDYGDLLPGMNVDGTIILEEADDVTVIPIGCLMRGDTVYVRDDSVTEAEGLVPAGFKEVKVETGLTDENYVEIVSGLEAGVELYESPTSTSSGFNIQSIMNGGMSMGGGMGGGMGSMGGGMSGGRPGM